MYKVIEQVKGANSHDSQPISVDDYLRLLHLTILWCASNYIFATTANFGLFKNCI
jgi:hypothetical protein